MQQRKQKRILIVDDDRHVAEAHARRLKDSSTNVAIAPRVDGGLLHTISVSRDEGRPFVKILIDQQIPDFEKSFQALKNAAPKAEIIVYGREDEDGNESLIEWLDKRDAKFVPKSEIDQGSLAAIVFQDLQAYKLQRAQQSMAREGATLENDRRISRLEGDMRNLTERVGRNEGCLDELIRKEGDRAIRDGINVAAEAAQDKRLAKVEAKLEDLSELQRLVAWAKQNKVLAAIAGGGLGGAVLIDTIRGLLELLKK